ncbi:AAA family ATPase, partial [Actinocorallia lasiicapitis]
MPLLNSPVFVGRSGELAVLRAARARVAAGEAAVVLAGAEAGGGKTRLTTEFLRDEPGFVGGCLEVGPPYAPFSAILRRIGTE